MISMILNLIKDDDAHMFDVHFYLAKEAMTML